jgi:putative SOS response-associated peptidase YedK
MPPPARGSISYRVQKKARDDDPKHSLCSNGTSREPAHRKDIPKADIAPSWNVPPTDPLPVVRYDARGSKRALDVMRWRLVPFWAKNIKVGFANINAKAEGIESKPAFREAFQRRRCLVPVDNSTRRPRPASSPMRSRWLTGG